jgi:hypothetical protein
MQKRLEDLSVRVARWRKSEGGRGSRVPAELWEAAAEIARVEGAHKTSRTLRLNYTRLKEVMNGAGLKSGGSQVAIVADKARVRHRETGAEGKFMALGVLGGSRTLIDCFGQRGRRMRIEAYGPMDMACLAEAFWSRTR